MTSVMGIFVFMASIAVAMQTSAATTSAIGPEAPRTAIFANTMNAEHIIAMDTGRMNAKTSFRKGFSLFFSSDERTSVNIANPGTRSAAVAASAPGNPHIL